MHYPLHLRAPSLLRVLNWNLACPRELANTIHLENNTWRSLTTGLWDLWFEPWDGTSAVQQFRKRILTPHFFIQMNSTNMSWAESQSQAMCCKSDTPSKATQTWKLITVIEVIKVLLRTCRKYLGNIQDGITKSASGGGLCKVSWWV